MVGCHYFPPSPQLLLQPKRSPLWPVPNYTALWQRNTGVSSLPKANNFNEYTFQFLMHLHFHKAFKCLNTSVWLAEAHSTLSALQLPLFCQCNCFHDVHEMTHGAFKRRLVNCRWFIHELDNVAINDVLPLKAARRDASANLKCFWGIGHQIPNFDGYIYIQYAAPPYSARITAMYFLPFGNVWFGFGCVQHVGSTMKNSRRVGENSDLILSRLWTKVHEIFRRCRKPRVVSNALFRLSVSRFV